MAAMMKQVPWGPATSFHDACETAWAVCFFLFVEGRGLPSPGDALTSICILIIRRILRRDFDPGEGHGAH